MGLEGDVIDQANDIGHLLTAFGYCVHGNLDVVHHFFAFPRDRARLFGMSAGLLCLPLVVFQVLVKFFNVLCCCAQFFELVFGLYR